MIKNTKWLDTHLWGVRAFASGMRAKYNGHQFKRGWNTSHDWNDKPECGGGFHLMTPAHNGFGFCGHIIRVVEYTGRTVPLRDKIKVEKLRCVACTPKVLKAALTRCNVQLPKDGDSVVSGLAVILRGRPRITLSGGYLYTCDRSQPRIAQSGGYLFIHGQSQPRVIKKPRK